MKIIAVFAILLFSDLSSGETSIEVSPLKQPPEMLKPFTISLDVYVAELAASSGYKQLPSVGITRKDHEVRIKASDMHSCSPEGDTVFCHLLNIAMSNGSKIHVTIDHQQKSILITYK